MYLVLCGTVCILACFLFLENPALSTHSEWSSLFDYFLVGSICNTFICSEIILPRAHYSGLVTFNDDVELDVPISLNDRKQMVTIQDKIIRATKDTKGQTKIPNAVLFAIKTVKAFVDTFPSLFFQTYIHVLTDGVDTRSTVEELKLLEQIKNQSNIIEQKKNCSFYSFMYNFGSYDSHSAASALGAYYISANSKQPLEKVRTVVDECLSKNESIDLNKYAEFVKTDDQTEHHSTISKSLYQRLHEGFNYESGRRGSIIIYKPSPQQNRWPLAFE